ncbi:YbaB/EbfC family nucleoid-associated protein [Bacteroidota bacterium]
MFDTFKLLGKLSEIKDKMKDVKQRLQFVEVIHETDDSLIKVYANAVKEIKKIEINENMITPMAKTDLEERLKNAINETLKKCDILGKAETKEALAGSLPDIPGLDLDNLPI